MSNNFIFGYGTKAFLSVICFFTLTRITSCNNPQEQKNTIKNPKASVLEHWINWKVSKDSIKYGESERYVRAYLDSINKQRGSNFTISNWKGDSTSDKSLFTATADLQSTMSMDSTTPPAPPLPGPRIEF